MAATCACGEIGAIEGPFRPIANALNTLVMSTQFEQLLALSRAGGLSEAQVYQAARQQGAAGQGGPGRRFLCPVCEHWSWRFLPYGLDGRRNARCPHCGSVERHRFLWLHLQPRLQGVRTVLHVAPEPCIRARLQERPGLHYIAADRYDPEAEPMDLTDLPLPDGWADLILCSHVLEHIPDDRRAMAEIARVLRPGGRAVVMVPVERSRATTYEDESITTPEARQIAFGHPFHVRICGRDYGDRLRAAGLRVTEHSSARLSAFARRRWRINKTPLFDCLKPVD
jgi:SAM-dependent methyltransferase